VPTSDVPEQVAYWNAKTSADFANAKTLLYDRFLYAEGMQAALNAGYKVIFEECGAAFANPNVLIYMQDFYDFCKARNIGAIVMSLMPYPTYTVGMLDAPNYVANGSPYPTTLNALGQLWAKNMLASNGSVTGTCQSFETSIGQDGCSSGLCCCFNAAKAYKNTTKITIDGNLNEWSNALSYEVTHVSKGTPNNKAIFKTIWDNNNLYVAFEVNDSILYNDSTNLYDDDSVEIYVDGLNDKKVAYGSDDKQYIMDIGKRLTDYGVGTTTKNFPRAVVRTTTGYRAEIAIPFSDIGITPSENRLIGWDIGINDDDNGGVSDSQLIWYAQASPYNDTSKFGNLLLTSGITQTCSDGTPYGSCSNVNKPSWCDNSGNLIPNQCGTSRHNCLCPSGTCQSDGSCKSTGEQTFKGITVSGDASLSDTDFQRFVRWNLNSVILEVGWKDLQNYVDWSIKESTIQAIRRNVNLAKSYGLKVFVGVYCLTPTGLYNHTFMNMNSYGREKYANMIERLAYEFKDCDGIIPVWYPYHAIGASASEVNTYYNKTFPLLYQRIRKHTDKTIIFCPVHQGLASGRQTGRYAESYLLNVANKPPYTDQNMLWMINTHDGYNGIVGGCTWDKNMNTFNWHFQPALDFKRTHPNVKFCCIEFSNLAIYTQGTVIPSSCPYPTTLLSPGIRPINSSRLDWVRANMEFMESIDASWWYYKYTSTPFWATPQERDGSDSALATIIKEYAGR
jgi:hypothetical protein